jgi:hypothetical protein
MNGWKISAKNLMRYLKKNSKILDRMNVKNILSGPGLMGCVGCRRG